MDNSAQRALDLFGKSYQVQQLSALDDICRSRVPLAEAMGIRLDGLEQIVALDEQHREDTNYQSPESAYSRSRCSPGDVGQMERERIALEQL